MANIYDNWYESMAEAIEVIEKIPTEGRRRTSLDPSNNSWAGGSFERAMHMAKSGWKIDRDVADEDIEKQLEELQDRLNAHIDDSFREVYDVAGGFVDINRFLQGEPECMVEQWVDPAPQRGKVLKVVSMCTASSSIGETVLRERGRAVAVAVEVLHRLGFNIELWAGECVAGGGALSVEMVKIKDAADPMDWDAVMFPIAHPTFLRRFIFALNESRPENERSMFSFNGGGYGTPRPLPTDIANGFDLVLDMQRSNHFDRAAFMQQVLVTAETVRIADVEV